MKRTLLWCEGLGQCLMDGLSHWHAGRGARAPWGAARGWMAWSLAGGGGGVGGGGSGGAKHRRHPKDRSRSVLRVATAMSLGLVAAAMATAAVLPWLPDRWLADGDGIRLRLEAGDRVSFVVVTDPAESAKEPDAAAAAGGPTRAAVHDWWPDPEVLGDRPGRPLRRMARELAVGRPGQVWRAPVSGRAGIGAPEAGVPPAGQGAATDDHWHWLCGRAAVLWWDRERQGSADADRSTRAVLVHPGPLDDHGWKALEAAAGGGAGAGAGAAAGVEALVVPEWELDWWSPQWEQWAEANGVEVIYSQGSGVNIERALDAVVRGVTAD